MHDYSFFVNPPYESETEWANHLAGMIGVVRQPHRSPPNGAARWRPGSKNGVSYDTIDYSIPSGSFFADYLRGVSGKLRALGVGSVYWPGLRDGDWYSLTTRSGSGSGITLSLVNPSGLTRLQYAWGLGSGGGTYVKIRNAATSLCLDGMGRTTNGANAGQSASSSEHQPAMGHRELRQLRADQATGRPASTWTAWAARPTAPRSASTPAPAAPTSNGRC